MKGYSLDDLQLFVQLAQYQNLTQAADSLNVPLPTLSRRLKKLEQALNCRLVDRSSHHFTLTKDGERYRQLSQPFLHGLNQVQQQLHHERQSLRGQLNITAPINMTQAWLKHCIYAFSQQHPEIVVSLQVQNEKIDLLESQMDVAFRVGDELEPEWVSRELWHSATGLCASSQYLAQYSEITHPTQLCEHRLVAVSSLKQWSLTHQVTGESVQVEGPFVFESNDVLLVRDAVMQGMGISWIPPYYFTGERQLGHGLVPVLPDWLGASRSIKLMYRDRDHQPARVKAFIQHVLEWKTRQPVLYTQV